MVWGYSWLFQPRTCKCIEITICKLLLIQTVVGRLTCTEWWKYHLIKKLRQGFNLLPKVYILQCIITCSVSVCISTCIINRNLGILIKIAMLLRTTYLMPQFTTGLSKSHYFQWFVFFHVHKFCLNTLWNISWSLLFLLKETIALRSVLHIMDLGAQQALGLCTNPIKFWHRSSFTPGN